MHILYIVTLVVYINIVYINNAGTDEEKRIYSILLALGIMYPTLYDWSQMFRSGLSEYLADMWNYIDMLYIWSSIGNIVAQNISGPFALISKILMIIIIVVAL